jgi:hypothetical protein
MACGPQRRVRGIDSPLTCLSRAFSTVVSHQRLHGPEPCAPASSTTTAITSREARTLGSCEHLAKKMAPVRATGAAESVLWIL